MCRCRVVLYGAASCEQRAWQGAAFAIADAHERLLRPPAEDGIDDGAVLAPRVSIPQAARSLIAPTQFPPPECVLTTTVHRLACAVPASERERARVRERESV